MPKLLGEDSAIRCTPAAIETMQSAIAAAEGREVFFAGGLDDAGKLDAVRVCARGQVSAVTGVIEGLGLREVVIHNHPSGNLEPSDADLALASIYSKNGHGVFIIDNEAARVYVVIEPFIQKAHVRLQSAQLDSLFKPNGQLAEVLPDFEVRPQQTAMMEAVSGAFNDDGIAVIEAPTGVGKTLAYLLPAVLWSLENRERVVISTRTINLQEQIIHKDIPLLQRCLNRPFSACLVKGRGNYICLRRLQRAFTEATLFDDEEDRDQLNMLAEWVKKTKEGSRSDLPFVPGRQLWEQVCSEADSCGMGRCPNQKDCFVGKARREIAKADILVVNHHMFFSDIAIKKETGDFSGVAVLPAYDRVIFDEAHSIEDSATEYLGINATRLGALASLGRFFRLDRGRERGLIPYIKLKLIQQCPHLAQQDHDRILALMDEKLLPFLSVCREGVEAAFDSLRDCAGRKCGQIGREVKWRLTETVLLDPELRELHETAIMPTVADLRRLVAHCRSLHGLLEEIDPREEGEESPVATEIFQLAAYARRLENLARVLAEGTSEELDANSVRWIEMNTQKEQFVRIARAPLEVGQPLAEWVLNKLSSVVLTSATLTVQKQFHYLQRRIGLDHVPAKRVQTLMLDSPFDFSEQALLTIPEDIPLPDATGFLDACVDTVRQLLTASGGHAFVLFTSFYALDYTHRQLEEELAHKGITALKQGQANRTVLLDRFRNDTSSVLFGTDSFWEGVDVAGESLQCVILPKLPFRVPSEPIQQARAEAVEAAGENPFTAYSVPQAVIKFRQGFGRLIRRRSDRGIIAVLDRRVITKYYGRMFLESLPAVRLIRGPQKGIQLAVEDFFKH